MKKNFKTVSKALMIGAVAMTSFVFASCSDDYVDDALNNNSQAMQVNTEAKENYDGAYSSTLVDLESDMKVALNVSGNRLDVSSSNNKGENQSASATVEISQDGKVLTGQFDNEFHGIKDFTFQKVGTFYFELKDNQSDGTDKLFGFTEASVCTRGDMSLAGVADKLIQKGAKLILNQIPFVSNFSDALVGLIPSINKSTPEPGDMKVQDCFKQLTSEINAVNTRIDGSIDKMGNYYYKAALNSYQEEASSIISYNSRFLPKVASLAESLKTAPEGEQEAIKAKLGAVLQKWAENGVNNNNTAWLAATNFLHKTCKGIDNKSWFDVFDTYYERTVPWEHMAYEDREAFRTLAYMANVESALLLSLSQDFVEDELGLGIPDEYKEYVKPAFDLIEAYDVVRDEKNYVCQIPGANHVKIVRDSFTPMDKQKSFSPIPGQRVKSSDFILWSYKKDGLTISEIEAIKKYYGNDYTMGDIFAKKLNMPVPVKNAMLITKDTNERGNGSLFGSNQSIYLDKVVDMNAKTDIIQQSIVGWATIGGEDLSRIYYKGNFHTSSGFECVKLKVDGRTEGWTAKIYEEK